MKDQPDIVARLRAYTQHDRPVLSSDLKEAADCIGQLRHELVAAITQRNNRAEALMDALDNLDRFTDDSAMAAGARLNPGTGRREIVKAVSALRRDRDALLPQDLQVDDVTVATTGHIPGALIPPTTTERLDEIDRRIAELESRVRLTERRLEVAALSLRSAVTPTPGSIIGRLVDVLSRTEQGLEGLARGIKESSRRG